MVNVRDVAEWFLSHAPMTHKKVQKLCYYAQAWYCALYDGSPLFQDEIQAWVHGPVIPSLYPLYADYKWMEIPQAAACPDLPDDAVAVLEAVYNTYGKLSGDELERLTHSEEPWKAARGDFKPWIPCNIPISCEGMRRFYRDLYDKDQAD